MSYSPKTMEHFNSPRNVGTLEHPTAVGSAGTPGRGNYMVIHLLVEGGIISDIRYQTYGCPGAIAAGSAVTELARGKTLQAASGITRDAVDGVLGGLPLGKGHCADLAASALQSALAAAGGGQA
ncbi:MAG TPA: iron-sulfur cluster assembly scaffold protein [Planctomycetota bacterium]|nr:iron-sulfur cluster assembly scaffold protein [Planctomycetota bacterium]